MRIYSLNDNGLGNVIAKARHSKNNNLVYRVDHGSIGKDLYMYILGLDKYTFGIPNTIKDTIELLDTDYDLIPIKEKRIGPTKDLLDTMGNTRYMLTKSTLNCGPDNRYLLFVSLPIMLPNSKHKWICSNNSSIIANATYGYIRGSKTYKSISPIIEVNSDNILRDFYLSYIVGNDVDKFILQTYNIKFTDNKYTFYKHNKLILNNDNKEELLDSILTIDNAEYKDRLKQLILLYCS